MSRILKSAPVCMTAGGPMSFEMERYFEKENIRIQQEPGDEEILRNNTIDFTSFSYYFSQVSTTNRDGRRPAGI